jgi:hypothetical protein
MRYDNIKQLKQTIKRLKEENEFLQKGIDSREDAHNYVCEQRDKSMALTQEITFLLLYIESIQELIKDDYSSNAKTIKRAIGKFKQELTDGFSSNHMILKLNNKLDNSDQNDTTHEI